VRKTIRNEVENGKVQDSHSVHDNKLIKCVGNKKQKDYRVLHWQ